MLGRRRSLSFRCASTMPKDTKLHKEAYKGVLAGVKEALRDGVEIDTAGAGGRTALQRACGCGHESVVKYLIKQGASVSVRDTSGRTALHWAAAANSQECLEAVMEAEGAPDVDIKTKSGNTALHMAADAGNLDAVMFLLGRGAKADVENAEGATPAKSARINDHKHVADALGGGGGGGGCAIL